MASNEVLTAAYQRMVKMEHKWRRHNGGSEGKPLRIATYWYIPASAVPGNGRRFNGTSGSRRKGSRIDGPMDSQRTGHLYSSSNYKAQGSSRRDDKARKELNGAAKIRTATSGSHDLMVRGAECARDSLETGEEVRSHRHRRNARPAVEDRKATQATPLWKEVRWSELPSRGTRQRTNTKAKRNDSAPQRSTARLTVQPHTAQVVGTSAQERTKSAFKNGEAAGNDTALTQCLPRLRSFSSVRPRHGASEASTWREAERDSFPQHQQLHEAQTESRLRSMREAKNGSNTKWARSNTYQHQEAGLRYPERSYPADAIRRASSRRRSRPVYGQDWRIMPASYTYQPTFHRSHAASCP